MSFSEYERAAILLCQHICNSFGLLGIVLILILYFGYPNIRIFAFKIILCLSISTGFYSIGILIGPSDNTSTCEFQAFLISYFSLSSVFWLLIISHAMHSTLSNRKTPEAYFTRYMCVGYILPMPSTIIPAIMDFYTRTSLGICWINSNTEGGEALIALQIWIILICVMIYTGYVLIKLNHTIRIIRNESEGILNIIKFINRLRYFSIIIYGSWTFVVINLLELMSSPDSPSFVLTILHILFNGIQGLFILVAFVKDHVVYEAIVDTFSTCLPCFIPRAKGRRKIELNSRA